MSFKIVKMAKGLLAKKCARKIVNCYRMFPELWEALAGGRALDKGERLIATSTPGHKHLRHLVVQIIQGSNAKFCQKTELSLLRVFVELLHLHFHMCCLPLESRSLASNRN